MSGRSLLAAGRGKGIVTFAVDGLSPHPLFDAVRDAQTVLLSGAGGGYDVYSAVPLYVGPRFKKCSCLSGSWKDKLFVTFSGPMNERFDWKLRLDARGRRAL
jgi:hypothetical protein